MTTDDKPPAAGTLLYGNEPDPEPPRETEAPATRTTAPMGMAGAQAAAVRAETVLAQPDAHAPTPGSPAPAPAPSVRDPRDRDAAAGQPRVYSDGVRTGADGTLLPTGGDATLPGFPLPYSSTEVLRRLGSYDLLAELGRGAMGVVYRAFSLRLCRPCAVKVMIAGQHASEVEIVRFQNEAMLAARLEHANIVSVFDAGEINGEFYFVMAFVEGTHLGDVMRAARTTDIHDIDGALRCLAQVARALHYAHGHGVVHRDIKPENILVDANGQAHITDFGIAKNLVGEGSMTMRGAIMGTPAYMAPEQANGEVAAIAAPADVYALGATLYHVLAGAPPFDGPTAMSIVARVITEEPEPVEDVARKNRGWQVPRDLETICKVAMNKTASARYSSAAAFADDLEAYLEDRPIAARPIGRAERLRKLVRRNRAVFVGAAVVFATLLVVGSAFAAVMLFNIGRTSDSLRVQAEEAALGQAETLERAIAVNMLEGRADVVRDLVSELRKAPGITRVEVVRVDRTMAYTDLRTAYAVQRRLDDTAHVDKARAEFPGLWPKIQTLRETAIGNIIRNITAADELYDYDPDAWERLLLGGEAETETDTVDGEPVLTVLKPIPNGEKCQVCHDGPEDTGSEIDAVRGVLVVQQSQRAVKKRIADNKRATIYVGLGTAGAILVLVWLFARIFGVRLRRRHFAS